MICPKWKAVSRILRGVRNKIIFAGVIQLLQMILSLATVNLTQMITDYIVNQQEENFFRILPWTIGTVALEVGSLWVYREILAQCKTEFAARLREQIARKQLGAGVMAKDGMTGAAWVNIYQNYVEPLAESISNYGVVILYPVQIICAVAYYLRISRKLLIAALILIPLSSVIYSKLSVPVQQKQKLLLNQKGIIRNYIKDVMKGFHTMKSYQLEAVFSDQYEEKIQEQIRLENGIDHINMTLGRVFILLQYIPQLIIPLYGGYLTFRGEITMGQFLAFGSMIGLIVLPVESILEAIKTGKEIRPAGEEINRILNWEEEERLEPSGGEQMEVKPDGVRKNVLEIENLTFGYKEHKPVIKGVNLRLASGDHVVLLGKSGSGKSTFVNLICGLYPVTQGKIYVGNIRVSAKNLGRIRQMISYVPQHPYIYQGTVAENIAMGKQYSIEEIQTAAGAAGADAFIRQLPQGYDTQIGNGILELSGGQKQRIGIARGILRNCTLFILDEPTSALDPESELRLVRELRNILRDKTSIIITHRTAVIGKEDRVLSLEGGKLVEA